MRAVGGWLDKNLDHKLFALVKIRASQINGCTFCLHMHSPEALQHRETPTRLILLDGWRRVQAVFAARTRRSGVDRSFNPYRRNARTGRCL